MSDRLSKKERGFVNDYVETGNGTESALKNYDTQDRDVAGVIASQNLGKLKIQNAIKSIAESISDEDLIKVHTEGLQAVKMSGENAEIDFAVRHKYLDSAYKLKGSYAPDKTINFNINNQETEESLAKAEAFDTWYKKQISKK